MSEYQTGGAIHVTMMFSGSAGKKRCRHCEWSAWLIGRPTPKIRPQTPTAPESLRKPGKDGRAVDLAVQSIRSLLRRPFRHGSMIDLGLGGQKRGMV